MMYPLFLLLLLSLSCNPVESKTNPEEELKSCNGLTSSDSGFLQLTDNEMDGEKLIIYGRVTDISNLKPIKNASLFLYQTDKEGNYNSTFFGMPSYAKIRGKTQTNNNGCFKIYTVVPGNYPGEVDGKHIHVIAKAKGYEKWKFEFLFEGWVNESTRREVAQKKDAIIIELNHKERNQWAVDTEIKLRPK